MEFIIDLSVIKLFIVSHDSVLINSIQNHVTLTIEISFDRRKVLTIRLFALYLRSDGMSLGVSITT